MITLLAGKLTPAASVLVDVSTHNVPDRKPSSITLRSSDVRPEWWYATPNGIVF